VRRPLIELADDDLAVLRADLIGAGLL